MLKNRTVNIGFVLIAFIMIISDVFGHVPIGLYVAVALAYVAIQVYGAACVSSGFFVPVKTHATASGKSIALTFDDGPISGKTEKILDILKTRNIYAAFFCIGYRIEENSGIVRRIHDEGHIIGNHSYWHGKTFDIQSVDKIADEIKKTDLCIRKIIGKMPHMFRPPYGVTNPMVAAALRQSGHLTVGWSIRSFDTLIKDSSQLMKRIRKQLKGGDIILFHDYSDSMLDMLPAFLDHVSQNGLKIVRVDELLNEKAYV